MPSGREAQEQAINFLWRVMVFNLALLLRRSEVKEKGELHVAYPLNKLLFSLDPSSCVVEF